MVQWVLWVYLQDDPFLYKKQPFSTSVIMGGRVNGNISQLMSWVILVSTILQVAIYSSDLNSKQCETPRLSNRKRVFHSLYSIEEGKVCFQVLLSNLPQQGAKDLVFFYILNKNTYC